jgi:hypothetical protein
MYEAKRSSKLQPTNQASRSMKPSPLNSHLGGIEPWQIGFNLLSTCFEKWRQFQIAAQ